MPLPSSIIGGLSGVVLLAGVVGFAVGLPEVTGDGAAAAGEEDTLPEGELESLLPATMLDGALVRISDIDEQYVEMVDQIETYGTDRLEEAFDAEVAVGRYATEDLQVEVSITVVDGESGFFVQTGPPVPPDLAANGSVISDMQRVDDTVCAAQWSTEAYQADAPPFQTQCQRTIDGRTLNAYAAGGLTVEQTAQILDDVVDQAQ